MSYNLLIVDDEEIAIRGIMKGINWQELNYNEVYTALDAEEAREILSTKQVHVILSDIDMPNENGLELLEWVNEHHSNCVTLFLTGHADFKYAQQAVQLASFDYLLKPIDHAQLQASLKDAGDRAAEIESLNSIKTTYNQFYQKWKVERPLLVERFWHDLIHYRQSLASHHLEQSLHNYNLPLTATSEICLVQISIEQWKEEWSARDEEIMTYAIKNVAEEFFLQNEDSRGHCIQDGQGILYLILYSPVKGSEAELRLRCQSFIEHARNYLHCYLSCYVGNVMPISQIREGIRSLLLIERANVTQSCTVKLEEESNVKTDQAVVTTVQFADWIVLLESGKTTQLNYQIDVYFDKLQQAQVNYHVLMALYFGFMNAIIQWLHSKGINSTDVMEEQHWEIKEGTIKSLARLKSWMLTVCSQINGYLSKEGKQVSNVVEKVQQYLLEHLHEEFSRERLAEQVYLNPAYLSRLFRRETGLSLTDYIVKLRMNRAKEQLENNNQKVSDIAFEVGYANFSHFSKLFKKTTGLTPQEYRKKYGKV